MKRLASKLLRVPILDNDGQKIGRLDDIMVETRTGSMTYLVLNRLDSQSFSEITQQLPSGESLIPVSVVKFNEDFIAVDAGKLKLLSLKKSLKKRAFLAKSSEMDQTNTSLP